MKFSSASPRAHNTFHMSANLDVSMQSMGTHLHRIDTYSAFQFLCLQVVRVRRTRDFVLLLLFKNFFFLLLMTGLIYITILHFFFFSSVRLRRTQNSDPPFFQR